MDLLNHEIWWNGDVRQQIDRGTYDLCRPKFVSWVAKGKIPQSTLDEYDKRALWGPYAKKEEKTVKEKKTKK